MKILKILNYWCYRVSNLSTNKMVQELQDTVSRHAQGMKYDIIILELQGIEHLTSKYINIETIKLFVLQGI